MSETNIHSTAIVDKHAEIGTGVTIGAYAVVGPKVKLHDDVNVHNHAVVQGRTQVGARTKIYSFATVGTDPQDLKYSGEDTELILGTDNVVREYSNMNTGTEQGGGKTVVGNHNLFMVRTHVAHDCIIKNRCILANSVSLAGHVELDDEVVIGGLVGVHQFVKIGKLVMCGGGSMVAQDVPPFCMVQGDRAKVVGLNLIGLKRSSMGREEIQALKDCYRIIYDSGLNLTNAIEKLQSFDGIPSTRDLFVEFLQKSSRGICRPSNS